MFVLDLQCSLQENQDEINELHSSFALFLAFQTLIVHLFLLYCLLYKSDLKMGILVLGMQQLKVMAVETMC